MSGAKQKVPPPAGVLAEGDSATGDSAASAGIGVAAAENGLYFFAAWAEPVSYLVTLIALRATTDPLNQVTATTLTALSEGSHLTE